MTRKQYQSLCARMVIGDVHHKDSVYIRKQETTWAVQEIDDEGRAGAVTYSRSAHTAATTARTIYLMNFKRPVR